MLLRLLRDFLNLFINLFIDKENEFIDRQIKKHYGLFHGGEYPLNRKQCEAVVKNKKYNQVIAAAGTGKTTVLSYRIKYLIEEGINPKRIIAITYSKKAANEMETRLEKQFNISDVEVRTIHSFANKIIREQSKEKVSTVTPREIKKIIGREFNELIKSDNIFQYYYFRFFKYFADGYLDINIFEDKDKLIDKIISEKHNILDEFVSFIDLAKKNNISPNEIEKLLNKNNTRQYYFGLSAKIIYEKYQSYLKKTNKIDFNDMLYKSVDILRKNNEKYYKKYDHMLVDEFQDVSLAHIELIKQFFIKDSSTKLFCVGDDWQSIYSFQGSEPKFFIKFERYFGRAVKTYLNDNYRCPAAILEAGNVLISNNKDQIMKKVKANNESNSRPILHILEKNLNYETYIVKYTLGLVKNSINNGCKPTDIMILCRYDAAVPYLDNIKKSLKKEQIPYIGKGNDYYNPKNKYQKPENAVSVFSIHQSKGREAGHVILLHVVAEDRYSFPEPERENELLEPVKINRVDHLQEERRLFYVAITRTSQKLDILTQSNNISPFIQEIKPYLEVKKYLSNVAKIGEYVNFTAKVQKLWTDHNTKIKQVGLLEDKKGKVIKFLSWSDSKAPLLEENIWYKFRKVKISTYNNKREMLLTDITEVIQLYENKG